MFAGKENKMSKDNEKHCIWDATLLPAQMPKKEYEVFVGKVNSCNERLIESAQNFDTDVRDQVLLSVDYNKLNLKPQREYTDIPFRMEECGDVKSTVASSGCAILIAKFLERFFRKEQDFTIAELAKAAVKQGYRGYRQNPDGTYTPMGCKHVFFDRFIPALYGLNVERADNWEKVMKSLWEDKITVLLVKNSVYKSEPENKDSHFVVLIGYDYNELILFDPEYDHFVKKTYDKIVLGLKAGWIFSED